MIAKCNTLTRVTDNSTTVACHCTTVPVNSMMVSDNHTKVAGCGTAITGDPMKKHTLRFSKLSAQPLTNVTTADVI